MRLHELKIWPEFFDAIHRGEKRFEVRSRADRQFSVGDFLLLKEWEPAAGEFTGRSLLVNVTYGIPERSIPGDQVKEESVILGFVVIRPIAPGAFEAPA